MFSSKLSRVPSLQNMLKIGFDPTLKSINQFLLFLFQAHKFNSIVQFFFQLNSNQIKGNSQTHSIITKALLKLHKFEEAENLMNTQMIKFLNFPRSRLWDSLIQGFCVIQNHPEKALLLLKDCLMNHGILPSSFTFSSLIHSFSSQGNMSRAIEVLELMTDEKIRYPYDNFVCSSVVSGFCKIGKPELAIGFFENAMTSGTLRPNIATYTALLSALSILGRFDKVYDLVSGIDKQGLAFDVVMYSSWICGCYKDTDLVEAFRKHREMVDKGIKPDVFSYTILIDKFSKEGNVEKATGFLWKMLKDGVKANVVTYTAIMLGFCKKGKLEEAFTILKEVEDMGIEVDEFMYATLIDGVCRRGELDHAFDLLHEMEKKMVKPSIITYNTVINGLCKVGRTFEADKFLKRVDGDIVTYSTLLHHYTEDENVHGILETKRRLEDAGVAVDVAACNVLIKALFVVGAFEDAHALYQAMPEMNLIADSITYCTMINGYCRAERIEDALELFDEFRSKSLNSVACYNCMISGLCKKGMVDMAFEVFTEVEQKGFALDVGILMMLMKTTFAQSGAKGVVNLVYKLENFRADVYGVILNDAICFLCKRGSPEAAIEVYAVMRRKRSTVTSKSYHSLLENLIDKGCLMRPFLNIFLKDYGLAEPRVSRILVYYSCLKDVNSSQWFVKKWKESSAVTYPLAAFRRLVKDGRALDAYKLVMVAGDSLPLEDVVDYTILIDSICKAGYLSQALDLCVFARSKGITPDIVTYNSVINGLCRQGCLVEAFRLFDSLDKTDLVPSEITYATLIDNLSKQGFLLDARQLFDSMVSKGYKPNTHVYNSLIDNFCKFGKMDEAFKLLYDMEMKGFEPNGFTISALINGYCQKGDMEGALDFFSEFKKKDIVPDFLGFVYMVRGLHTKGRIEEARNILGEMLQSESVVELINTVDKEVESESVESFLIFLCEQGRISDAVVVLNKIASILYPVRRWSGAYKGSQLTNKHSECRSLSSAVSEPLTSNQKSEITDSKKVDKLAENYDISGKRSKLHDFGFYYSLIGSLCSKGELQKANELVNELLSSL
ncbi:hypothetical protein SLA2020_045010 [Shorea laevis]